MEIVIGWDTPIDVIMPSLVSWTPHDPLALTIAFGWGVADGEPVVWTIARDLLDDASGRPNFEVHGSGDAQVMRHGDELRLKLDSPDGSIVLSTTAEPLLSFLEETYVACARGGEDLNVDAEIERLLS